MHQRIEDGFAALGRVSAQHPWWIIFLTMALTALLASALPPRFDTTMEGFLRENSQAVRTYNQLREDFGRDEMMVATAVGIGDSIHLLTIFVQQLRHQTSVEAAIVAAMRYTGLAMLLTSLTTAAGLLSFTGSDILPLSSLGWAAASGVMLAWIYSITLLPACLALTGRFWPLGEAASVPRAHGQPVYRSGHPPCARCCCCRADACGTRFLAGIRA